MLSTVTIIEAKPHLLFLRGHFILDIPHQRYPHLCRVVAPQHITNKVGFNLHLHLNRSVSQGARI